MKKRTWFILATLLVNASVTTVVAAENGKPPAVEDRLNRLERVESLQSELQRLVGEIEVQKHTLGEIKKRQRDLYLDIDRRILQIERGSGSAPSSSATSSTYRAPEPQVSSAVRTAPVVRDTPAEVTKSPVARPKSVKKKEGEQVAYQKAFDLLRALRYEKATLAFRQFLNDFPDGRYAHIAQYWLAETSYHTRKFSVAVEDYQTLINQYPKSPKRADALLKIGYSQFELKLFAQAENVLNKLIKSYPGTTEAGQAENLLQKIRLQKAR